MALTLHEYASLDLMSLQELVRTKKITSRELLDTAERAIESVDPKVKAIGTRLSEYARARLDRLPEGTPGIPFLIKEDLEVSGLTLKFGSGILKGNIAPETHDLAKRYEDAGLLFVGQTKMSELGLVPYTEPQAYGVAHNPWNLAYSTGGSSGGSAAAVAARMVPAAHGSDGGGSIRIPASINGLFGLKPSRGLMPAIITDDADGFISRHALTRSVRDSAYLLDISAGPNVHNRFRTPGHSESYLEAIKRQPKKLRIAFTTQGFVGGQVDPECRTAIMKTVKTLTDLGHQVDEVTPKLDYGAYVRGMTILWAGSAGHFLRSIQRQLEAKRVPGVIASRLTQPGAVRFLAKAAEKFLGYPPVEDFTLRLAEIDARYTPGDLWGAWIDLRSAQAAFGELFEHYDLFMSSTLGQLTHKIGAFDAKAPEAQMSESLFRYVSYCAIPNTSGFPAMSVPLHQSANGLPVGVHFIGPWADDALLLTLAAQLEEADPWRARKPPTCVGSIDQNGESAVRV